MIKLILYSVCITKDFKAISTKISIYKKRGGGLPLWLCLQCGRPEFYPWVGKIPWRRAWQPTPGFLPGESPWTEEPGRLQSMGLQRVGHDRATKHIQK